MGAMVESTVTAVVPARMDPLAIRRCWIKIRAMNRETPEAGDIGARALQQFTFREAERQVKVPVMLVVGENDGRGGVEVRGDSGRGNLPKTRSIRSYSTAHSNEFAK